MCLEKSSEMIEMKRAADAVSIFKRNHKLHIFTNEKIYHQLWTVDWIEIVYAYNRTQNSLRQFSLYLLKIAACTLLSIQDMKCFEMVLFFGYEL